MKKMKITKAQSGITLIALVVTIIILLILAGVAINVALGDNGLFSKSKEAVEKHKESSAKEKISMSIGEYMLDINFADMSADEQDNKLKEVLSNVGTTNIASDDKYYEIEVDGYIFWVNRETQEIISQGPSTIVAPTAIGVKNSNIEITIGETKTIGLDLTPLDASKKFLRYTTSDDTIATVSNGVVKGIALGTATITIESIENSSINATVNITVLEPINVAMTIEEAKAAIQKDGLKAHLGQKVEYKPTIEGKVDTVPYRIFYYNTEEEWGDPAGTLYLKRDYVDNNMALYGHREYIPSNDGLSKMKEMNPQWARSSYSESIDVDNEHYVAWLCDPVNWNDYKTGEASYAIGSPSVEMYIKSFNIYKSSTGTVDSDETKNALMCKVESGNGYSLGAQGTYTYNGSNEYYTGNDSIEEGPAKIYMNNGNCYWWLASPSNDKNTAAGLVCAVYGDYSYVSRETGGRAIGFCPIIAINP